jgi:hypothetical protein
MPDGVDRRRADVCADIQEDVACIEEPRRIEHIDGAVQVRLIATQGLIDEERSARLRIAGVEEVDSASKIDAEVRDEIAEAIEEVLAPSSLRLRHLLERLGDVGGDVRHRPSLKRPESRFECQTTLLEQSQPLVECGTLDLEGGEPSLDIVIVLAGQEIQGRYWCAQGRFRGRRRLPTIPRAVVGAVHYGDYNSIVVAVQVGQGFVQGETHAGADRDAQRVLFVMRSLASLRYYQSSLELLASRGHDVHFLLERGDHGAPEQRWLDSMSRHPNFAIEIVGRESNPWHKRGIALRAGLEYLHFHGDAFRDLPRYSLKALRRSPPAVLRRLADLPILRSSFGHRWLYRILAIVERALPEPPRPAEIMDRIDPDVVVVGDAGNRDSASVWFIRAARRRGTPSVTCVASWDNLSTRPRMRTRSHRLVVWNREQLREAVAIHGVSAEDVFVTGAANFDQWFAWKPRPEEEFRARVGLDPGRHFFLWVCSALNKWEQPEHIFFGKWLAALRAGPDPRVREAAVLLRPHPLRLAAWGEVDVDAYDGVVMWPRGDMTMPVDSEQKADYYDSIFHSRAVVGINTSAMIEASIIGRPVLSVLEPAHYDSQFGALHFRYLVELGGGFLRVASSLDAHFAELAKIMRDSDSSDAAARGFVAEFLRPHGVDRPATPLVVDAIEQLAATSVARERDPLWLPLVRRMITAIWKKKRPKSQRMGRRIVLSVRRRVDRNGRRAVRRWSRRGRTCRKGGLRFARRLRRAMHSRLNALPPVADGPAETAEEATRPVRKVL